MTYVVNTFKNKKLFKVDLNWKGEVHKCYTQASTPEQALRFALQQLSHKLGLSSSKPLLQYFDGSKANYEIKEVTKSSSGMGEEEKLGKGSGKGDPVRT